VLNSTIVEKKAYIDSYKQKGTMVSCFELFSSLCVMLVFGLYRSIIEINPIFHKPLDLESGKVTKILFRNLGP